MKKEHHPQVFQSISELLRTLGLPKPMQQHIHAKLIEKAKDILSTSNLSVAEIAYQLGFDYPQSFNKLFKSKTEISPLEYRRGFSN
ncbi:helix-turn-helix domain-containing protein [Dyadobacter sp. SG02]|uniref:helix-turn-helix domain-containing protein n=1 Tax=Dyadobacter sp. SG02 TaxID=1855291 RepID=UPI000A5A4E28|nr:helix-turn-helix domain-containing protein [Dyadobacter sp. SG02]